MNKVIRALNKIIESKKRVRADDVATPVQPVQQPTETVDPRQQTVNWLQKQLMSEFLQWDLYYSFKDQVYGNIRDSIVTHFEEHAADEAAHIGILQSYLVNTFKVLPTKERTPVPALNSNDANEIIKLQLKHEQDAVKNYSEFLNFLEANKTCESCAALMIDVENILIAEQSHAHDFEAMVATTQATAKFRQRG